MNAVPVPVPAPGYFWKGRTPGIVPRSNRTYGSLGYGYECRTVQNLQKFRVRVIPRVWFSTHPKEHNLFTSRSSGYGYEFLQNSQKFRVGTRMLYLYPYPYPHPHPGILEKGIPVPPVLCHGRAELTEVPVRYGSVHMYPTEPNLVVKPKLQGRPLCSSFFPL